MSGGETRASALWGKGSGGRSRGRSRWGHAAVPLLALLVAVAVPTAGAARPSDRPESADGSKVRAHVPADLVSAAEADPDGAFDVIVQGEPRGNSTDVASAVDERGKTKRRFDSIIGVSATLSGKALLKLARHPRIESITPDASLHATEYQDAEMWRATVGLPRLWKLVGPKSPPAIAVIDSGIDAAKALDFGARVVASVNFCSIKQKRLSDDQGHGTMVAGIAAGASSLYPGVAKDAPIVDVRTATDQGESKTSDIVAAVDWIIANKARYNIRVANLSMVGTSEASFRFDPLNRAVEKLWFNNVVVVVAAGNHGSNGAVPVPAPANDPFVITVGATDQNRSPTPGDDVRAPWSAYGYTADGFSKPDIGAPGRFLIMPVPAGASIPLLKPERVKAPGYIWMSGTSFSAPVVSGAAAAILARNPAWTADQVKGALMLTATPLPGQGFSVGVGEIAADKAAQVSAPPNPNERLYQFVESPVESIFFVPLSERVFKADKWVDAVKADPTWSQANWTSANWTSANWSSANWTSANWTSANWTSANWTGANWTRANWTSSAWVE